MYQAPLSDGGRKRLEVLRETEDGFRISETELQMRGAGDLKGQAKGFADYPEGLEAGAPLHRIRQRHGLAIAEEGIEQAPSDAPPQGGAKEPGGALRNERINHVHRGGHGTDPG